LFGWLALTPVQHQPPVTSQPAVFLSHNKSASATSHQPAERGLGTTTAQEATESKAKGRGGVIMMRSPTAVAKRSGEPRTYVRHTVLYCQSSSYQQVMMDHLISIMIFLSMQPTKLVKANWLNERRKRLIN
jgi:hypothetical protein